MTSRDKFYAVALWSIVAFAVVLTLGSLAQAKRPQRAQHWIEMTASKTRITLGDTVRLSWTASDSPGTMIYDGRWHDYPSWLGVENAATVQPSRSDYWRATMYDETWKELAVGQVWIEVREPRK